MVLKKLKSNSGMTAVFALCVFMVACVLSVVMVSGALSAVKNTSSQQKDEQKYLSVSSASNVFINKVVSDDIDRHIDYVFVTDVGETTLLNFNALLPSEFIYSSSDLDDFEDTLEEYGISTITNTNAAFNLENDSENPIYEVVKDMLENEIIDSTNTPVIIDLEVDNSDYSEILPATKFKVKMDEDYSLKINANEDMDKYNTSFILSCSPLIRKVNVSIPYTYVVYVNKDSEEKEEGAEPELVPEYRQSVLIRTINIYEYRWSLDTVQKGKGGVFND